MGFFYPTFLFRSPNQSSREHRHGHHKEDVPSEDLHVCDRSVRRWNRRCSVPLQVSNNHLPTFCIPILYIVTKFAFRYHLFADLPLLGRHLSLQLPQINVLLQLRRV